MLGISIYPDKQDKQAILDYIKLASKYNFKRIFSCLLSVDKDPQEIKKEFLEINNYAKQHGMMVILDVSPRVFDQLGISYSDLSFFEEIGADGVRLDIGFNGKVESDLSFNKENLFVEINMSMESKYLDNVMSFHPNTNHLIACHNFYPQRYTGLSLDFFNATSLKVKNFHLRSAAFVTAPSATVGPWPLSHGLCTLEMHRDWNIKAQAKHLLATRLIDDVIIGDAFANEKELSSLANLNPQLISLSLTNKSLKSTSALEQEILFENPHFRRGDTNEYSIRSTQSRVKYKSFDFPSHDTPKMLKRGDVVIGNNNFQQYKGELQIIIKDHENIDLGCNVVGRVIEQELILLDYIHPMESFSFEKEF